MKKNLFAFCLTFSVCLVHGQKSQSPLDVKFQMSNTGETFTLTIKSKKDRLTNCELKIIDSKGETVKTVNIPEKSDFLESTVSIQDIAIGKYSYFVICDKHDLCNGEFTKDIYDAY
jgi:hypothetical protein